jgi:hypothetical protein
MISPVLEVKNIETASSLPLFEVFFGISVVLEVLVHKPKSVNFKCGVI